MSPQHPITERLLLLLHRVKVKIEYHFETFPLGLALCLFALAGICAYFGKWFWFASATALGAGIAWMSWQMARSERGQ